MTPGRLQHTPLHYDAQQRISAIFRFFKAGTIEHMPSGVYELEVNELFVMVQEYDVHHLKDESSVIRYAGSYRDIIRIVGTVMFSLFFLFNPHSEPNAVVNEPVRLKRRVVIVNL
jgi:hypothetical protein